MDDSPPNHAAAALPTQGSSLLDPRDNSDGRNNPPQNLSCTELGNWPISRLNMSGELRECRREVETCGKRECWDVERIETTLVSMWKRGGGFPKQHVPQQSDIYIDQFSFCGAEACPFGHRSPILPIESSVRWGDS